MPFELQIRAATGGVTSSSCTTPRFYQLLRTILLPRRRHVLDFQLRLLRILKTSANGYEEAANNFDLFKLLDFIPRAS